MTAYLCRKLGALALTLYLIITLTFILMKALPGDPLSQERSYAPEVMQALREHYGLEDPLLTQYTRYLGAVAHGDLGPSFVYKGRRVNDIIRDSFPISARLALQALTLAVVAGVSLGSMAALWEGRWPDKMAIAVAVLAVSLPNFILATLLQYLLALKWGLLPIARWGSLAHTVLPTLALAALPTAFVARLTRSSLLEVLSQDYVRTATAKGLGRFRVLWRHALRNSLLPVFSYVGQLFLNILVGSFVVERIFGVPGLGQWFVTSVSNRDYSVIMGLTIFYSTILLAGMLLIDLAYAWVDPRIVLGGSESHD